MPHPNSLTWNSNHLLLLTHGWVYWSHCVEMTLCHTSLIFLLGPAGWPGYDARMTTEQKASLSLQVQSLKHISSLWSHHGRDHPIGQSTSQGFTWSGRAGAYTTKLWLWQRAWTQGRVMDRAQEDIPLSFLFITSLVIFFFIYMGRLTPAPVQS